MKRTFERRCGDPAPSYSPSGWRTYVVHRDGVEPVAVQGGPPPGDATFWTCTPGSPASRRRGGSSDREPARLSRCAGDSLTGVLFACLAGLFLGALNITMRRGLARVADVDAGSAVIAVVAFVGIAATALAAGSEFDTGELWPFLLLGAFVPGVSQLLVVHAVQAAGASRAGILFGMAPLFSALIAIVAFDEPLMWPLAAGTLLVVAGGVALAGERRRPVDKPAYSAGVAGTRVGGVRPSRQRRTHRERGRRRGRARAVDGAHGRSVDRPGGEPPAPAVGVTAA